jgi:integrase
VSVKRVERADGPRYIVWWKNDLRQTQNKTFRRKADADAFDAKIKLAKRSGDLEVIDAGKETLNQFHQEWRRLYAEHHLATKTLVEYDRYLKQDILPALGHRSLRKITPLIVQAFASELAVAGRGDSATRKILTILQGVLQRAVEWQRITTNPVRAVRKPTAKPRSKPEPISPSGVEAIRSQMAMKDAALVSVMAYAGLRPGEALALTWGDIHKRTIVVNKAVSLGEEKDTKTGRERSVPLRKALAQDLKKWKLKSGRPSDDQLVFPAKLGGLWRDHDYRNWRKRNFMTAVEMSGVVCPRPYDLRHCCASLRFAEGVNPAEIASEMGHSLETLLGTYTHVIKELAGQGVVSGDKLIGAARRVHILVTRDDAVAQ